MAKIKRSKYTMSLTESINAKLDANEPSKTSDPYAPTKAKTPQNFMELIGEESYFSETPEELVKPLKSKPTQKVSKSSNWLNYILYIFTFLGFVSFVFILINCIK